MNDNIDKDLADIFSNSPLETELQIQLPSKGKFYRSGTSMITIRPLVFEDEKSIAIASRGKKVGHIVNTMLSRCIKDQDPSFLNQMVIIDKVFVIVKLREISYGRDYQATISCPACEEKTETKIDISALGIDFIDDDKTEPIEVYLPTLKKKAKVSVARVEDEPIFDKPDVLISTLWKYVREIDGKTNPILISKAIQKMPIADAGALIQGCLLSGYGVNTDMVFECPHCQNESVVEVPISSDFFSVKSQTEEI